MATTDPASDTRVFVTDFSALNNSGVHGAAVLTLTGNTVTVDIDATGLEPNQVHAQHIHGLDNGADSHSPTLAQDVDHDGFVELGEGLTTYGPILLNLDNNPGDLGLNADQFPVADASGHLRYQQTFTFDPSDPNAASIFSSINPLENREIVLHGETVAQGSGTGTSGEVDGTAGYKPVLPVASGEIHEVSGAAALAALGNFQAFDQSLANGTAADGQGTAQSTTMGQSSDSSLVFATDFSALNNSGVHGGAVVTLTGHTLTVDIAASGLEPGQAHPQHIHGLDNGADSHSPTLAQDVDHDGFVELAEGQATYGPILLNLDNNPGDLGLNADQFPVADAHGNLVYHQTFNFDPLDPNAASILGSINPLQNREIVLHGETVAQGTGTGTPGEVDGIAGYKAVLPVASGELHQVSGVGALAAVSNFQAFEQSLSNDPTQQAAHHDDLNAFALGNESTGLSAPPSTVVLHISEDAFQGDAQFVVSVDGFQQGGIRTATASHGAGQVQDVTITGDFGASGPDKVDISFINDTWAGTPSTDRNLYVQSIDVNGQHFAGNAAANNAANGGAASDPSAAVLDINGTAEFDVHHTAPPPEIIG